jgi:hypothetical protein
MTIHEFVTLWLLEVILFIFALTALMKIGGGISLYLKVWKFQLKVAIVAPDK